MVERYFLALDYSTSDEIVEKGFNALKFLEKEFGEDFARTHIGIKLNQDMLTGLIDQRFNEFKEKGCEIFADLKIGHGPSTGKRIIDRVNKFLPIDYFTVSAILGDEVLKDYVRIGNEYGAKVIAWTVHTKTSPEAAYKMLKQSIADAVYNFASVAAEAGCDAVVLEGERLKEERVRNLPIKKLVTGIRIKRKERGEQRRVTTFDELAKLKPYVNYVVISHRYVDDLESLKQILYQLK